MARASRHRRLGLSKNEAAIEAENKADSGNVHRVSRANVVVEAPDRGLEPPTRRHIPWSALLAIPGRGGPPKPLLITPDTVPC